MHQDKSLALTVTSGIDGTTRAEGDLRVCVHCGRRDLRDWAGPFQLVGEQSVTLRLDDLVAFTNL